MLSEHAQHAVWPATGRVPEREVNEYQKEQIDVKATREKELERIQRYSPYTSTYAQQETDRKTDSESSRARQKGRAENTRDTHPSRKKDAKRREGETKRHVEGERKME